MMPFRALPPGVSALTPGGSGVGTALCGPVRTVPPADGGGGCPGCIYAGAAGDVAGGTASDALEPGWP